MSEFFWQQDSLSHSSSLCPKINYDYAIVGQGITGLSLAYWISKQNPTLKIIMIDSTGAGNGASGRNAGFLTRGSLLYFKQLIELHSEDKAKKIWKHSQENIELIKKELSLGPNDSNNSLFEGSYTFAKTREQWDILLDLKEQYFALDENVKVLKSKFNNVFKDFIGALYLSDEISINPYMLLQNIRAKCQKSNSYFEVVCQYKSHLIEKNQIKISTKTGVINTKKLIFATNGYTKNIADFKNYIRPVRAQMLALKVQKRLIQGNCYYPFEKVYFRQLLDGTILIGGKRLEDESEEETFKHGVTQRIQDQLERFALSHFPSSWKIEVVQRWSGIMGFTPDSLPIMSKSINDHVYFCGGYNGHGLGHSFLMAREFIDYLNNNKEKPLFWNDIV